MLGRFVSCVGAVLLDLRIEGGAAAGDAPQRPREVRGVGDAVLEEVTEALGRLGEHLGGDAHLDVV